MAAPDPQLVPDASVLSTPAESIAGVLERMDVIDRILPP
jgi:hypothetical protein